MNSQARLVHWLVWSLLGLVIVSVAGVYISTLAQKKVEPIPVVGAMPDFTLTNQFGEAVSPKDLHGNIWVADVIFTRCPGPCWQMSGKMKAIQDRLRPGSPVKLVSLSADPEFDSPAVLKEYAARIGADPKRWHFLTGPKREVYQLAIQGLKLAVEENPDPKPNDELFIHSTRLMLVDRQGRLRAASFDGTEPDSVPRVLRAIEQLLSEGNE